MLRARRGRARARSPPRAREHALAYDADRVLDEHWLPALEQVALRLPGLVLPLGPSRARRFAGAASGIVGSTIAPIFVPVFTTSRNGCAWVIAAADDVEEQPARDRPGGRGEPGIGSTPPAGTVPPWSSLYGLSDALVLRDQARRRATARAGSPARSAALSVLWL